VVLYWELASPRAVEAAAGHPLEPTAGPGAVVVEPGAGGIPVTAPSDAETLRIWIPDDIVGLRTSDPQQAEAWREVIRRAVSGALANGYRGEAITRDGWLLLTR
jgi:predicted GNAT superfamily acetyltransferase